MRDTVRTRFIGGPNKTNQKKNAEHVGRQRVNCRSSSLSQMSDFTFVVPVFQRDRVCGVYGNTP